MLAKDLLAIVKLGDAKATCEAFAHVLLSPRGVAVHGGLDYAVRYACAPQDAPIASAPVLVPPRWLRDLLGPAGAAAKGSKGTAVTFDVTYGDVEIPLAPPPPKVRATVRGKTFDGPEAADACTVARAKVAPADAPAVELHVGDFAKGGPVASVIPSASRDARPHVHAVHLADHATATNGHQLARRPLRSRLPVGMLVPLPMATALCALVDATKPVRLVVRRTADRAWFTGRTISGARWTVSGRVDVCDPPPYEQVIPDVSRHPFQVDVDVAELRAMVASVGASRCYCAIYPCGGVVTWTVGSCGTEGVSVSMEAYDGTATPIVVWGPETPPATLKALPKAGTVRVTADDDRILASVDGAIVMGCKQDAPKDELLRAFAATIPAQGTWRDVFSFVSAEWIKAYTRPVLHLGPPTVDELAHFSDWRNDELPESCRAAREAAKASRKASKAKVAA